MEPGHFEFFEEFDYGKDIYDFVEKNYIAPFYVEKVNFTLMENDNELNPTHGRTILKTIDGKIIVSPTAPEFVDMGTMIWKLSEIGKERWNKGLSINYYACRELSMPKHILKADFE